MILNYIRTSWRLIVSNGLHSVVGIGGLALSYVTALFIFGWAFHEINYDKHFKNADRIYRVTTEYDGGDKGIASTYAKVQELVLTQFPEIETSTRIYNAGFLGATQSIIVNDQVFTDESVYYGDPNFFEIFSLPILKGDRSKPLDGSNSVVLTEKAARKYFGDDDAIGRTINLGGSKELVVTAVVENIPSETHFSFDALITMNAHAWVVQVRMWSAVVFHTYIKVREGTNVANLNNKIDDFMDHFPNDPEGYGKKLDLNLQPLTDIHLKSAFEFELQPNGSIKYVLLFFVIGILVLLVASFNYINLTLARHAQRFKEMGMRKVLGAQRKQLVLQLAVESCIAFFIALVVGVVIYFAAKPVYFQLADRSSENVEYLIEILLFVLIINFVLGLLSGVIPALSLSQLKPTTLFKSAANLNAGGLSQGILVVAQFSIAITLAICTMITFRQLQFVQNERLGFDRNQIVVLHIGYKDVQPKYKLLKQQLLQNSNIINATVSSQLPTNIITQENIDINNERNTAVNCISVDKDFFSTLGIKLLAGERNVSHMPDSIRENYFVLSEAAAAVIGWNNEQALANQIRIRHGDMKYGNVVGVASNIQFQSLHNAIGPLVYEFNSNSYEYLLVKVKPQGLNETIKAIESTWKKISAITPFSYSFLDQSYERLYDKEKSISRLFTVFSAIALFISVLGLFALVTLKLTARVKEIGIRKVLGASFSLIFLLLAREFLLMIFISFAISVPAAYQFQNNLFESFISHPTGNWVIYVATGLVCLLLAFIILLANVRKATNQNPIKSLRSE